MPSFMLRNIDREFWDRVKTRARGEQLPLDRLALRLFELYERHGIKAIEEGCQTAATPPHSDPLGPAE